MNGAALYERAKAGWEDFVQRAKLGGDISPQMKQIDRESEKVGFNLLTMLLDATQAADLPTKQEANDEPEYTSRLQLPSMRYEAPSAAMLALADAATAELQQPPLEPASGPPPHRTILPQPAQPPAAMSHAPTDPRSFLFPRPELQHPAASLQRPPSRRILPANIPPLNERLVLPDPFGAPGGPPPQLPPPQGPHFPRSGPYHPPYLPGPPQSYFYHPPLPPPASSGASAPSHRQHY